MFAMHPKFNERKATQIAGRLLRSAGGQLPYLSLIKLIYLADRAALDRRGVAISGDSYFSLPHGPVVSEIMRLCRGDTLRDDGVWVDHIHPLSRYDLSLNSPPGEDELSEFEIALIDEVFAEHGSKTQYELRDFTHTLPEWTDPDENENGERRIELPVQSILVALGKSADEIEEAEATLQARILMDSLA